MKGTLIFAQSGGPTAVINASACGVIKTALNSNDIDRVLCARYGIEGVLKNDFIDMNNVPTEEIDLLKVTPASAFGSCRYKLPPLNGNQEDYNKILETFNKYNVRFFIYNGGNDSMDTCNKIALFLKQHDYQCSVIGVPKTIDNDLDITDHCPGYGSASKYVATTCHEIALDTSVYRNGRVTIVEIMGRDAGWLTASSAIATAHGAGPDLIYLPEHPFDLEQFVKDCTAILTKKGNCLVALSEGIKDKSGHYITTVQQGAHSDGFSHQQLGGVASMLANMLTTNYKIKSRAIELSLSQRCAGHISSKTDTEEAYLVGKKAVEFALNGKTNQMVVIKRISDNPYKIEVDCAELNGIANAVKKVPANYINAQGNNITEEYLQYVLPLIQGENTIQYKNGLPRYSKLNPKY